MFIQVITPRPIKIHSFALRGRDNNSDRIFSWCLQASLNGTNWTTLYETTSIYIGSITQFFSVDSVNPPRASYYKLVVNGADGVNPGLSYFQLFIYDENDFIISL